MSLHGYRFPARPHTMRALLAAVLSTASVAAVLAAPAYVPNDGAVGVVAIVDTATRSVRPEHFATPPRPFAAVASLDGRRLYVMTPHTNPGFGDGQLSVFSVVDRALLKTFLTATNNDAVAVSPNSRRVYVNSPSGTGLLVIDSEQLAVVSEIAIGAQAGQIVFSPNGAFLYTIAFEGGNAPQLLKIDAKLNAVAASIPLTPLSLPVGLAVSPDGAFVYVGHLLGAPNTVSVVSTATNTVVKIIAMDGPTSNLAITPNGQRLYAVHNALKRVSVIDAGTASVVASVPLNDAPYGIDVTPDGRSVYVLSSGGSNATVISTETNTVVSIVTGLSGARAPARFIGPEPGAAVEFYHAPLDHYFVTSSPSEIADLDSGLHPGWARTRQSFLVFPTGSSGVQAGPVCRYYGLPSAGLDSHFYSASQQECSEVGARFPNAWVKESDNVFELALPDLITGVCAAGALPVYRLWNNRADSNHRYTTDAFTRQAMLGRGFIAEGYGPNGVAMCSPTVR